MMQNSILTFRQSSCISQRPAYLFENFSDKIPGFSKTI